MRFVIGDGVMRPIVDRPAADPSRYDLPALKAIGRAAPSCRRR
jgi:hypothetical protein